MNGASREQLHDALEKAIVVEQQLGLQYLYAAASLQWIPPENLAPDDPLQVGYETARGVAKTLLLIARQEMEHQCWVLNLLIATGGGPPSFDFQPMPMELPIGGPALLQPFSREFLLRLIADERPDHIDDPAGPCAAPEDLQEALAELERTNTGYGTPNASAIYDHYVDIYQALLDVERADGPVVVPKEMQRGRQVVLESGYGFAAGSVDSFEDALAAVDQIVLEGEGGSAATLWWQLSDDDRSVARERGVPSDGPPQPETMPASKSHFCRLVELWPHVRQGAPPIPVLEVPADGAPVEQLSDQVEAIADRSITHPFSAQLVDIANKAYGIQLDALRITYASSKLDQMDGAAIDSTAYFQSMTMTMRPLLMILARLPRHASGEGSPDERAGMTFRPTGRFEGPFDATSDAARRNLVARLSQLSSELTALVGHGLPEGTVDFDIVRTLLDGLRRDLLRIGENLAIDSSTPLGA